MMMSHAHFSDDIILRNFIIYAIVGEDLSQDLSARPRDYKVAFLSVFNFVIVS